MVTEANFQIFFDALSERRKSAIYELVGSFFDDEDWTDEEKEAIREGLSDIAAGRVYADSEIDWENIGV